VASSSEPSETFAATKQGISIYGKEKNEKTGKSIVALTVKDILDEQIAYKLA
jgi:hypothetical protein